MSKPLIVGIGSHHSDDQVGWAVATQLADRLSGRAIVHRARSPLDMLVWLSGVDRLAVCDACSGSGSPGTTRRWSWPTPELNDLRWGGTHDMGLPQVLLLAERLGCLPSRVTLWTVEANTIHPGGGLSAEVEAAVPIVAEAIANELNQSVSRQVLTHHA